jgi:hypothetical protein
LAFRARQNLIRPISPGKHLVGEVSEKYKGELVRCVYVFQDLRIQFVFKFTMVLFNSIAFLLAGVQLITFFPWIHAQDAPLFIQGGLEDASAVDAAYNTGGTISINGFTIRVPENMLVQFPAAWVPWREFVNDKGSMLGYEINVRKHYPYPIKHMANITAKVIGNFLNGLPIAGQILAYQFFEGLNSGFIESINFQDGSLKIMSGPTVRISDPNAVFSVGYSGAPLFTADDESPSISSFSGFPMCIPRNSTDPLCPATNRPFQGSGTL